MKIQVPDMLAKQAETMTEDFSKLLHKQHPGLFGEYFEAEANLVLAYALGVGMAQLQQTLEAGLNIQEKAT